MSKLTAIIIAKDEEEMLGDCLDSVKFCDEIVVVDTGSKDDTVQLAKKKNAKVFCHAMIDYADIRNKGKEYASNEWILYIDADERITKELAESMKEAIKDTSFSAFKVKRKNFYFGNHEWPYVEKLERLFRKEKLKKWVGPLHESPVIDGDTGELDGFLLHYTHRNLSDMVKKTLVWSKVEAELRYKAGHPKMAWWRFPRVMSSAFFDSYIRQSGWKAGVVGIIESMYQSFSIFVTYARLWELQKKFPSRADQSLVEKVKSFDHAPFSKVQGRQDKHEK